MNRLVNIVAKIAAEINMKPHWSSEAGVKYTSEINFLEYEDRKPVGKIVKYYWKHIPQNKSGITTIFIEGNHADSDLDKLIKHWNGENPSTWQYSKEKFKGSVEI